ncbi:class I SAM-dependent methyltransferase, partial [Xanthobacter wiegelii]|uniref:class I SAM-dependent methyltransferase n=1 Tax=Xanthobacter wiegelii TaxID=3119913 RepID=UPI00372A0B7F
LLMAETAPADGRILVVGAGGGLELRAFAEAQPGWSFVGIDPSAEMLKLATRTLGPFADRVDLHDGYIASAPTGPFDAACCLLTLHFVALEDRLSTLAEIRRRLKPGAQFVLAHHSAPDGPARGLWFDRFGAFAAGNGVPFDPRSGGAHVVGARLPILSPEEEVDILRTAGFTDPQLFYAALTFRGWVARA